MLEELPQHAKSTGLSEAFLLSGEPAANTALARRVIFSFDWKLREHESRACLPVWDPWFWAGVVQYMDLEALLTLEVVRRWPETFLCEAFLGWLALLHRLEDAAGAIEHVSSDCSRIPRCWRAWPHFSGPSLRARKC